MRFDRDAVRSQLQALAGRGVYLGTSSWKYPGWLGQLYDESRYVWRGRFAESRFEKQCLAEYAEVFPSVCVDAAYYKFPDHRYLEGLTSQVPAGFQFAFKVTDEITIRKFTNLPRFGLRAGKVNENFLNADLFQSAFLGPCEPFRDQVGLLIFEFSRFYPSDFACGRDFVEALDGFLARLPAGWPYGVEIRNAQFLHPQYFDMLRRRSVTHVFNSWEGMPPVEAQLAMPGSLTHPTLCGARFLLRPGRKYAAAVDAFQPYREVKDVYPEGRDAMVQLIRRATGQRGRLRMLLFVNNRFEGSALGTIQAILEQTNQAESS